MTAKPYYPAAVLLFAVAIPAAAQTPSGLGDLVGARAAGGEQSLQSRGYHYVKTQKSDDRSYSYWWNPARQLCVTVATMDGRYDSITPSPAPDCDQSAARDGRSHGGTPHDDGRDDHRPESDYQVGYGGTASTQRQSPSYVEERDRYHVDGQYVDLGLVCFGDGQRPGVATTYGWTWNSRTNRYDYGNRTEMTGQQFDASLMIQLWGNGGRIRHHLRHNLWRANCDIIFPGFQARGTLGRQLVDGADFVTIFGEKIKVRARRHTIGGLSAHADQDQLAAWYGHFHGHPPVALVHGEDEARKGLAERLHRDFKVDAKLVRPGQHVDI